MIQQQAGIFKLPFQFEPKRVFGRNHSSDNEFRLQVNFHANLTYVEVKLSRIKWFLIKLTTKGAFINKGLNKTHKSHSVQSGPHSQSLQVSVLEPPLGEMLVQHQITHTSTAMSCPKIQPSLKLRYKGLSFPFGRAHCNPQEKRRFSLLYNKSFNDQDQP